MGGKPRPEKPAKLLSALEYKTMAEKLASCVVFALSYLDAPDDGVVFNLKTGKTYVWQDKFFDALDACDYIIDRKDYWARRNKKAKKRRRR